MSYTPPSAPNLSFQFDNDGSFGGSSYFTWDTINLCVDFNTGLASGGDQSLWRVPAANTGDGVDFRFMQQTGYWTNGPSGAPDYYDDTMSWGWNIKGPLIPVDPTKGAISFTMENLFYQSGVFAHEVHLQNICVDGTTHRPMTFFIPTANATSGQCGLSHEVDFINWNTYGGTPIVEWNLFNNNVAFQNGFELIFNNNNVPIMKQNNAAGTASIILPYIDADTRLNLGTGYGFLAVGTMPSTGSYPNQFAVIQPTNASAGATIFAKYTPVVTGQVFTDFNMGSVTGDFTVAIYNNANAAAANANIELRTIGSGAGDPSIKFNVNGATEWQVGLDNSDSDKFKISLSGFNPGADQFTLNPTSPYDAHFLGPIGTGSYTVATLPAASTALKGCRAFVTDAISPSFLGTLTGGGSVVCPVFCNGTAWVAG